MNLPKWFNIIPVKDKKPIVAWAEFTEREQTPEEKIKLMALNPNGAIGVICGAVSKILVLDIDGPEGVKSLEGRVLPKTWTVKTPHGMHYYFLWIEELENKVTTKTAILNGVDIRGNGGYAVHYGWRVSPEVVQIARPPQWLIDLLPNKNETNIISKVTKTQETLANLKDGNRNASFTSLAGSLRSRNYKVEEIFELLKPKAAEVNFSEEELWTICQSVGRYEPKGSESQASSVESFLEQMEAVEWLCEPIVAKQTLGFIAGLPETGKTWMLIDLAIECARGGGKWLKRFPVKAARVLFIDQERFKGETQRRFKAVIAGKEMQPKDLKGKLFIRCGTTTRIDLQNSFEAFRKEVGEIKPDLIIIDSFVTFHSSDENNRQSIQLVLERIKQIRNEFGCTFLFIDHENKGAFHDKDIDEQPSAMRMSGSVAKPAAAELVLTVRKQDAESSFVYHTKSTLASTIPPFLVKVVDMDAEKTKISVEAF